LRIVPCIGGLHLASCYVADSEHGDTILQTLPKRMRTKLANPGAFALTLPFDKWAGNCDNRQAVFVKRKNKPVRYGVVFPD